MESFRIAILTAIEMERRAVVAALAGVDAAVTVQAIGIRGVRLVVPQPIGNLWIVAGVGGALDPGLAVGDVILDDPQHLVPPAVPLRRGAIHTAGQIITTAAEKAALCAQTGTLAVDMEQSVVASVAEQRGVSWMGVRAVSDTAAEALDPAFLHFVDDLGRPKPAAIAMGLLRRPALAGQLRRLEKNSGIALQRLGAAVREIVLAIGGDGGG